MARIATISDNREYSEMTKWLLERHEHTVEAQTNPVDFEQLFAFKPEILIVTVGRRATAIARPIEDYMRDVIGSETLRILESYPPVYLLPVIVVGIGIQEHELRTRLRLRRFVRFPEDLYQLIVDPEGLSRFGEEQRSRRVSPYGCPNCSAQMIFVGQSVHDLFCRRCYSVVSVLQDEDYVLYSPEPGAELRQLPKSELHKVEAHASDATFAPLTPTEAKKKDE
ncbi:MAG TPA: hypothetical protein DD435_02765 [Cyanobacteria bacterium UBA8530]|nr:hypothetical protein [Cyanobacteria bacterium UBA8530]